MYLLSPLFTLYSISLLLLSHISLANASFLNNSQKKPIFVEYIKKGEIHILSETPPYPDYVWASHPTIGKDARGKIISAFLSLSPANKSHVKILSGVDAGGFLPASIDDFLQLGDIAHQIGLLDSESHQ